MSDRPILFSAPMVRALLDGRKTQTRRVIADQVGCEMPIGGAAYDREFSPDAPYFWRNGFDGSPVRQLVPQPVWQIGDHLWVKETWNTISDFDHLPPRELPDGAPILFPADGSMHGRWAREGCAVLAGKVRQSIFMQKRFSRLTITVTDVRVERLQNISEEDARAEGIEQYGRFFGLPKTDWDDAAITAKDAYSILWNDINGPDSWEQNPWVVAVSFTVDHRNIDTPATIAEGK